jgi:alpha-mannosidase
MDVTLVPHTHWDREWYEPFDVFIDRLVPMMDTLLDLAADGFPHFHLDGQTAMIDDYLARRPERADELAGHVREGRLSAGPWVTQMDEFLVSGESHVRNLRMGLERARELGADPRVGYLPDQFGHIGQMPRILSEQGLEWALVWRGVPAAIDRSTFRWRSTDGNAEVLCEYMPFGYSAGARLMRADEPEALAAEILAEVERMRPFLVDDRLLIMVGYDHAGPDATLPERLERAAPFLPGVDARIGSIDQHVQGRRLGELPVWAGELRSSARAHLLPNVVSSRVHQKLERGRLETLLERHVGSPPEAEEELRRAWTLMLWNGAHDSACGCSHDRVAIDVDGRFAEARTIAEGILGPVRSTPGSSHDEVRIDPSPHGIEIDGVALRFFDEPDVGDLYNFCPAAPGQHPAPPDVVEVHDGRFEAVWDDLRIVGRLSRIDDGGLVVIEGEIHNERPDHRLRLHVGLRHEATTAVAGAPFELVGRPLVGEGSEGEAPSSTWPARHMVMASGTAVLHEGVFEYEVVGGRELAVTLLRCVGTISRESLAIRPFAAGPGTPTPGAQMLGVTEFRFGVTIGAVEGTVQERWDRFALAEARRAPRSTITTASRGDGGAQTRGTR